MENFTQFRRTIETSLLRHPVILRNSYTEWFAQGLADETQLRDLIVQFSVFSNHFLILQAKRMVNADTEEGEICARNILVNELGVGLDVRTGSVEGKTFSTRNAHLNWLRDVAAALGLAPMELGRWKRGSPATHEFLDGLDRTYGSRDGQIGAGASFAIENWAAHGIGMDAAAEAKNFWAQLIAGLKGVNARRAEQNLSLLPLGFFKFHFEIESGHGANVWHELEETFQSSGFDQAKFLEGGRLALDAIDTFWLGSILPLRRWRLLTTVEISPGAPSRQVAMPTKAPPSAHVSGIGQRARGPVVQIQPISPIITA